MGLGKVAQGQSRHLTRLQACSQHMEKQQQLHYRMKTTTAADQDQYCKAESLDRSYHLNFKYRLTHLLPAPGPEASWVSWLLRQAGFHHYFSPPWQASTPSTRLAVWSCLRIILKFIIFLLCLGWEAEIGGWVWGQPVLDKEALSSFALDLDFWLRKKEFHVSKAGLKLERDAKRTLNSWSSHLCLQLGHYRHQLLHPFSGGGQFQDRFLSVASEPVLELTL